MRKTVSDKHANFEMRCGILRHNYHKFVIPP